MIAGLPSQLISSVPKEEFLHQLWKGKLNQQGNRHLGQLPRCPQVVADGPLSAAVAGLQGWGETKRPAAAANVRSHAVASPETATRCMSCSRETAPSRKEARVSWLTLKKVPPWNIHGKGLVLKPLERFVVPSGGTKAETVPNRLQLYDKAAGRPGSLRSEALRLLQAPRAGSRWH